MSCKCTECGRPCDCGELLCEQHLADALAEIDSVIDDDDKLSITETEE